jgi:hypothetical protein
MIPVREREQFSAAVRTKIILEIAGLTPPEPLVKRAQQTSTSCLAGEMWRERWGTDPSPEWERDISHSSWRAAWRCRLRPPC